MFLDESDLLIRDRNIYTAHEICQMKLLWDRNGTYRKFIRVNSWIREYLPNWQPLVVNSKSKIVNRKIAKVNLPFTINYSPVENLLKDFQLVNS